MHDFDKFLPPLSKKGDMFYQTYWSVHNKYINKYEISIETKEGIHKPM